MRKAIPPDVEPEVMAKAGEGLSTRQIAAWLTSERGIKASPAAVLRLLTRITAERRPIADAVAREKLAGTIAPDLDAMAGLEARSVEMEQRLSKLLEKLADEPELQLRAIAEHRKERIEQRELYTRRLEMAGAGGDQAADQGALQAELLRSIEAEEGAKD
jgi:hypothetical protein